MATRVNGNRAADSAAFAHVASAERVARAIVLAFEACDDTGAPLSEVQKIALLEAVLLEFDGFAAHLRALSSVGQALRELDQFL
jgi:hypothetical protein